MDVPVREYGDLDFLAGGGDMGARIRAFPWGATPLQEPEFWPQGLRTAARIVLTTGHPTMLLWGPTLLCLYNDAFSRCLGPEKHPGILGAPGREAWKEVWPLVGGEIEQVLRGEGAVWHENRLVPILRNGALQDVYWTYSYNPVDELSAPRGVGGVLVICSETTQQALMERRLAAERELAASERAQALNRARLDYATRLSGVGFWYCDLPFDVLEWDDRVKEHFFFAPGEQITIDKFYDRIHPEDRNATRDAIDASIRNHAPYDIVYRTVHPETGAIKWIRALGGTDYGVDGAPTHFDGVTVDVTAQKLDQQRLAQLNQQLREHDQRKDEFIATLSHELRNPLAPIRAAARVIVAPQASAAQQRQAQLIIERQVTHMALLLEDLLDIARITQGKLQLRKQSLALIDVVDAAVEAVRPALEARKHGLTVRLPAEPVFLEADHLRLSQILSNLLTNAAKYSDPGRPIELSGVVSDGILSLSVKDEGIGIARESLAGIFDMFSQIDGVAGRSDGGLGIGLALVKGLTALHGGTVEARSAGLGQGSEFIVRLACATPQTPYAPTAPVSGPVAPQRRRLLIADDNRDAAASLSILLELAGHDVRVAHGGQSALSLAQVFRPDVALLDIGMPDLSGYEVAQALRREPWGQDIQLVALTGWGQDSDRRRALEAGFDHHLIKPVDTDALNDLIARPAPTRD